MNLERIRSLLGWERESERPHGEGDEPFDVVLLHDEQQQEMESAISVLDDEEAAEKKVQEEATRAAQSAAQETLKRLRLVQMGRCPLCGAHLRRHLFASVCEACGWYDHEVPRRGPVRVYLRNRPEPLEAERAYWVKPNALLLLRDDAVVAWVNRDFVIWVDYGWSPAELEMRYRQILDRLTLLCGWCNKECNPDQDGFHVVQVAFGSTQERYTFCSDACYEAFRKMYPARVDRNCYERNCADCNLCIKRYDDEGEGLRLLAKDYLRVRRKS